MSRGGGIGNLLKFCNGVLLAVILDRAAGFDHTVADIFVEDQFGRGLIDHGGVYQSASLAAAIQAIDFGSERSGRAVMQDEGAMVAGDETEAATRGRLHSIGRTQDREFKGGIFW